MDRLHRLHLNIELSVWVYRFFFHQPFNIFQWPLYIVYDKTSGLPSLMSFSRSQNKLEFRSIALSHLFRGILVSYLLCLQFDHIFDSGVGCRCSIFSNLSLPKLRTLGLFIVLHLQCLHIRYQCGFIFFRLFCSFNYSFFFLCYFRFGHVFFHAYILFVCVAIYVVGWLVNWRVLSVICSAKYRESRIESTYNMHTDRPSGRWRYLSIYCT